MPPPTESLPFRVAGECDAATVSFAPGTVLTDAHVEALGRRLALPTGGSARPPVTLDLAGVAALSSAALGKLLALHRAVRAGGGQLVLANPSPVVARVLKLTRLDAVFAVRPAGPARP